MYTNDTYNKVETKRWKKNDEPAYPEVLELLILLKEIIWYSKNQYRFSSEIYYIFFFILIYVIIFYYTALFNKKILYFLTPYP